jgi:exopolyphosphatase/guanosine-5'-triphosphate,3'-diphosphate pyrophosphatase
MDAVQPPSGAPKSRPPARRRRRPPVLAAIDLGSNNCRLLIAGPTRGGRFRVIESFSRAVRLGEGVAQTGLLTEAAIGRAVEALTICAQRIRRHPGARLRAIATEACRRAANADVLLARVREAAGIELDIITPEEEARLAAVGCAPLLGRNDDGALVFDIGGGSTELIWLEAGCETPVYATSVPAGVVGLAEAHGEPGAFIAIRESLMPIFADVAEEMARRRAFVPETHHLLGTSGTVTTLAALTLGLTRYERDKVDASWHDCADILAIVDRLAAMDLADRTKLGPVGPERADLVLAGCAVFSAIHAHWPCRRLRVADRGLREGMLRELMTASSGRP